MLNSKHSKKIAITALSAALVFSSVSISNAASSFRVVSNSSNPVRFTVRTNSNHSLTQLFQRFNVRVINNTSNQPQAPVQEPETPVQEPQENVSNSRHSLSSNEIRLVEFVNSARANAGLSPLAIDVDLSYVARVKSQDMHDNSYFSHTSPTYGSPFDMMRNFGIQYRGAAENIARTHSVESAHNGFMNSEGHRNNILNPRFTHIGIGIYNGYYTQMFIQK